METFSLMVTFYIHNQRQALNLVTKFHEMQRSPEFTCNGRKFGNLIKQFVATWASENFSNQKGGK